MAIAHDIYEFDYLKFGKDLGAVFEQGKTIDENLANLQNYVRESVVEHESIQRLCIEYGGYDLQEIVHQLDSISNDTGKIGFMLTLLAFSQMEVNPSTSIGLGIHYELIESVLLDIGWNMVDAKSMIYGNSFTRITTGEATPQMELREYLKYIKPNSTSSVMGWLNATEVQSLILRLHNDMSHIVKSRQISPSYIAQITTSLNQTVSLFQQAVNRNHGICIVISG